MMNRTPSKIIMVLPPFLLAVFWALRSFYQLQRYASFGELIVALLLILTAVAIVVTVIQHFMRDSIKTSILACICLIPFLFYGEIQSALLRSDWPQFSRYRYLLSATLFLMGFGAWSIVTTRRDLRFLNLYLSIVAFLFVIIELIQIASYQDPMHSHNYLVNQEKPSSPPAAAATDRDIYYVILDSYTSAASLKEFWDYDNSDFINYLTRKGFYVAGKARSNYNWTIYSMASSLNMGYLNVPFETAPAFAYRVLPMKELIRNSQVAEIMSRLGYEIVNLSLFDLAQHKRFYSFPLQDRHDLLKLALLRKTLLGTMMDHLSLNIDPQSPLKVAAALRDLATRPSEKPRFIYAHFMIPHSPYFFDEEGNLRPFRERIGKKPAEIEQQRYLQQLQFTNKLLKQTIDNISTNSKVPPIVIVQGDHGSWCFEGREGEKETTTILNAFYLPDIESAGLNDNMTPVNTFRIILNSYFRANYRLLPNEIFVADSDSFNVRPFRQ